jgi:integrase
MAVSKMLGHASYVTTLTVCADYITEGDGGKAAPLRRPVASSAGNVVPIRFEPITSRPPEELSQGAALAAA